MFLFYVSLAILAVFSFYFGKRPFNYWQKQNVVGPKPIPFFGNIKDSALRRKHIGVIYKEIYDSYPDEKIVGIYRMITPALIIRDLDLVRQIMIKDFDLLPDRGIEFSKEGLGDNLFHSDVETYRALRNKLTPLFTSGKLKNMMHLMTDRADKFVDYLESICFKQPEQEVHVLFRKYTIATIMAHFFGLDVNTIEENTGIFEKIDKSIFRTSFSSEMDMLYPGILKKTNTSIFNTTVNRFCYEVVEAVISQRNGQPSVRNNLLDLLLGLKLESDLRKDEKEVTFKLTQHVMAGQVFVFFAAGYGNNSSVLSFSMYHLAKNMEIQDRLIADIDTVLQRYDGQLTHEALNEMTYLDRVFDETLRMHPTTNSLQRAVAQDYVIPGTDVVLEKGMTVVISPLAIHNDEKIYPNPGRFDPDRFAPENMKDRHSCAYLPFGVGPRACLGTRFARMQYKVCVVKLLSKFRVEPSGRTKDVYKVNPMRTLLCADGGIYVNIVPRLTQK